MTKPLYVSSTQTTITIRWIKPDYTGGCPILSYAVFMNDGTENGSFVEVDPDKIRDKPYLT
jgi:hypothetical protein